MRNRILFEKASGRYVCNPDNSVKFFTKEECREYIANTGIEVMAFKLTKEHLFCLGGHEEYIPVIKPVEKGEVDDN